MLVGTLEAVTIAEDDPRQPFEQAADALRRQIEGGEIEPGQKVGSVRGLASRFNISPTTVQRALAVLREEGLVVTTGRGNFAQSPAPSVQLASEGRGEGISDVLRQLDHVNSQLAELRDRVAQLENEGSGSVADAQ
ncbi:GntR family transcriptional regulator [Streptomyces sp. NPDC001205]